jgi:hypothetical protein
MSSSNDNWAARRSTVLAGLIGAVVVPLVIVFGITGWVDRAHPHAELAHFEGRDGETLRLDTTGMAGTFDPFDVVANASFAESVAKAWADDAQLAGIRVKTCERGGHVALPGANNEATYEFVSTAQGPGGAPHRSSERHAVSEGPSKVVGAPKALRLTFKAGHLLAARVGVPLDWTEVGDPLNLIATNVGMEQVSAPVFGCTMSKLGDAIATKNLRTYSLSLNLSGGSDTSGNRVARSWRWKASGAEGEATVCDATCTLEGTPGCPPRW